MRNERKEKKEKGGSGKALIPREAAVEKIPPDAPLKSCATKTLPVDCSAGALKEARKGHRRKKPSQTSPPGVSQQPPKKAQQQSGFPNQCPGEQVLQKRVGGPRFRAQPA